MILCGDESRHISRVLRYKPGRQVELQDGKGTVYLAEIMDTSENVRLRILAERSGAKRENTGLLVGQGVIKTKKLELVLQKCTELGVDGFYPFSSSRCQGDWIRQYRGKGERWRRIIDEACKQCLRSRPMDLQAIHPFDEIIDLPEIEDNVVKLLFWEHERETDLASLQEPLRPGSPVFLLFGPEGGFSEEEIERAGRAGWQTVGLGQRILRAETAVIAAVSIVQHHLGNM